MGILLFGNVSDKRSWGFGSLFFFVGIVVIIIGKLMKIVKSR